MADIIMQWLRERLGIIVDVYDESFLKMVLNGQLIALVLKHYSIITAEQFESLEETTDPHQVSNKAILWLKSLDPSLDEDAVNCFAKAKLTSAIKLFYKLYLVLKGKDQLHFTAQSVIKQKLRTTNTRFNCTRVSEEPEDPFSVGPHPLSRPLQDHYHVIQWHKDRYKALRQRCIEARHDYMAKLDKKKKKVEILPPIDRNLRKTSKHLPVLETFDTQSLCETYDELKEQEKNALRMGTEAPNPKVTEKIIKRIKDKCRKDQEERSIKTQMETILVMKIWNETIRQQEEVIEMEVSKKILKQSDYEKQMASKIFEIREQKHIMAENRNIIQKAIQRQMDEAYLEYIFVKEKETGDERYRYIFERERTLELHQRIYDEKQRLMRERRENTCKDIVKDVVDLSLMQGEFKVAFGEEMPDKMKMNLVYSFLAEKSILDIAENVEAIIDYVPINDKEDEIVLEEIDRQNSMDNQYFQDYCKLLRIFAIEKTAPQFTDNMEEINLAKNILGHIVFRLLLTKYPKPPLPTPPDIPKVEVAVCITNISDMTILPILEKLLSERKIKIIQLEEVINYCLAAYKTEVNLQVSIKSHCVDEVEQALTDIMEQEEDNKNKKRKVCHLSKGQKPRAKQKVKFKNENTDVEVEISSTRDEIVQTPRVFPCKERKMSDKAELGKLAYKILSLGEPLSDEILVKMFVEYLISLKDIYGWVLVNYPQNFEQAVLLEEALTAKKVPQLVQSKCLKPQGIPKLETHVTDSAMTTTLRTIHPEGDVAKTITTLTHDPNTRNVVHVCTEDVSWEGVTTNRLSDISLDISEEGSIHKVLEMLLPKETSAKGEQSDTVSSIHVEPVEAQEIKVQFSNEVFVIESEVKLDDLADVTYRHIGQNYINLDKNAEFRVSSLLSNPHIVPPEEDYDTYLTALIRLKQDVDSLASPRGFDKEQELLAVQTPLDLFFQTQSHHYTLYYKALDIVAIKHLGKLIVGEHSVPPKSSVQIFGDSVLYLEADVIQPDTANETKSVMKGHKKKKKESAKAKSKNEDIEVTSKDKVNKNGKRDKSKNKVSDVKREKKGKINNTAEVMIERADKTIQVPTPEPESIDEFVETPEPVPGEKEYVYVDLPIDDKFQVSLATIWENVEEIYVYDQRELFFRKRMLWNKIAPYMEFVRGYMMEYIARPDEKQLYVFNFQKIYNSIDADLRDDDEIKSELHCRIYEFRQNLREICEQRMREAEEKRNNIILADWLAKQACELTSIYIMAMQIELDRCTDTMALLNDYYTAMVTKMPCSLEGIEKVVLHQEHLAAHMDFAEATTYKEFVREMLKESDFVLEDSPYHKCVRDNLQIAVENIEMYEELIKKEIAKIESTLQGKKESKKIKNEKKLPKFSVPEPEVIEQGNKLIIEWKTVINGEKMRGLLRINVVKSCFKENITDLCNCGMKRFHGIYRSIKAHYERELKCVESCCAVFSRAVEEEVPIQPQIILRGDQFYIDPNILLFEDELPEGVEPIEEFDEPERFTIDQLEMFVATMLKYAPRGVFPEQRFLFVLLDMVVFVPEDGKKFALPKLWRGLSQRNMDKLSFEFFGNTAKIDWKDFVLYNLDISFPTEEELIDTRRQFRELDEDNKEFVYDYQYNSIKFWYEKEFDKTNPQDLNRFHKIRKILFTMYAMNEQVISYTHLLLGFCKGNTNAEGVAKALALSLGKLVCHQREVGEAFVETLRERKREQIEEELRYELEEKGKLTTARDIVDTLVDAAIRKCDSYLTDTNDDETTKKTDNSDPLEGLLENPRLSESREYLDHFMKSYGSVHMYEDEYYGEFYHEEFSDVEIGYEAYKNPPLVYYLLFEILLPVLMAAMPWHAVDQNVGEETFRQKLEKVYEQMKNHEFDDIVFMHEFLNSVQFEELMKCTKKFLIVHPKKIIRALIAENI